MNHKNLVRIGFLGKPKSGTDLQHSLDLADGKDCYEQVACQFLVLCLQYARLNYNVTTASNDFGSFSNTSSEWTGLLAPLQNGEIDTIAGIYSYTEFRSTYFTYTRLFYDRRYVFMVKRKDLTLSQNAMLLLNGFSDKVWISMLVTLLAFYLCSLIIRYVSHCASSPQRQKNKCASTIRAAADTCWRMTRFILQQADEDIFEKDKLSISRGFLFALMSFFIVVIANIYQNILYNDIACIARTVPFSTTEQLVEQISNGRLTMLTDHADYSYFNEVNRSADLHFKMVRDALESNPLKVAESTEKAWELLESEHGGYVFVTQRQQALFYAADKCGVEIIDLDTPTFWGGYIFKNNSRSSAIYRKIDKAIFQVLGGLDNIQKRAEGKLRRACGDSHQVSALSVNTLSGLFFTFAALLALAIMCCVVERVASLRPLLVAKLSSQSMAKLTVVSVESTE